MIELLLRLGYNMTMESNENKKEVTETPKEEFFYTTEYPHEWSSGPRVSTLNPNTLAPIASLEEAKELAEKFAVGGYGESRCVTTYGVQRIYKVDEQA